MDRRAAAKPLDVGSGRVVASFDPTSAAWLSVGGPDPRLGFIELSNVPPFDEASRGDPAATRAHRLTLTDARHAWMGVLVDGMVPSLVARPEDPAAPRWLGEGIEVQAWAPDDGIAVLQRWRFSTPREVEVRLGGRLDRPALAEITEIDPPSPTGATSAWRSDPGGARLTGSAGSAAVRLPVPLAEEGTWVVGRARVADLLVTVELGEAAAEPPPTRTDAPVTATDPLAARAITYVRRCTALRTADDERVILTDHRILPLSWSRDAYWQALALLAADGPGDRDRVADHLRWLWRRCERPDGRWVRSHHANGRRKDRAFQADQQVYPILELADFWRRVGRLPDEVDWDAELRRAWSVVRNDVDPATGLVPSAENAADDPATAPFIAASQIIAWYGALRLAEVAAAVGAGPEPAGLLEDARALRAAFREAFAGQGAWPYAVDGGGARVAYHDANDLPVALAPLWGFVRADDPEWTATTAFAFGPANPGWVAGQRPGLGSAHTSGPWTLGDVQRWIIGRAVGDMTAMREAGERLREVAFGDGMLPEAYGADDDVGIRHWFAWPGATWAALRLLDASGRLESVLRARGPG